MRNGSPARKTVIAGTSVRPTHSLVLKTTKRAALTSDSAAKFDLEFTLVDLKRKIAAKVDIRAPTLRIK